MLYSSSDVSFSGLILSNVYFWCLHQIEFFISSFFHQIEYSILEHVFHHGLEFAVDKHSLSENIIMGKKKACGVLMAKQSAVLCGSAWFNKTFSTLNKNIQVKWLFKDGDYFKKGSKLCEIKGPYQDLLKGERVAINFIQTLSSVATNTHELTALIKNFPTKIYDTRKTIPGLRIAQKYAVLTGGGNNQRLGLFDQVLIKENHINAFDNLENLLKQLKKLKLANKIQIENQNINDLKLALAPFAAVSAVEDDLSYDKEELVLELTPKGLALGFTIDALGRELRNRLNGLQAATYPVGARSAAIRVELPNQEKTADFLETMQLAAGNGSFVPLADIVRVDRRSGFLSVRREDGIRLISITGEISEDDPAEAVNVTQALSERILPDIASRHQVEWRLAGLAQQENEFLTDALLGLILCLTGIYLVLAWVFASWTRPLVVMSVIPFGVVGTIFGHYIWDIPMSMFTVVGLLGMTGIIINDSIVLITSIDEQAKTKSLIAAIIDGTTSRLRPVLLTTLTTVLGLLPLLYERSSQAGFMLPTVITLVYGLAYGLLLVLMIVFP